MTEETVQECSDCVHVNVCLICVGVEKVLTEYYDEDDEPIHSDDLAVICKEYVKKEGSG